MVKSVIKNTSLFSPHQRKYISVKVLQFFKKEEYVRLKLKNNNI